MSYRPDNQSLSEPLRKILAGMTEGLTEFSDAVDARIEAGPSEWLTEHIDHIKKVRRKLLKLKDTLTALEQDNW